MGLISDKIEQRLADAILEVEKHSAQVAAGLAQWQNGMRLTGHRTLEVDVPRVWGGSGRLVGWSVKASGGPVTVLLRDSRDAEGGVIAIIDLVTDEHETVSLPSPGVSFGEGLYLDKSGAGTLVGAVWIGAVD